MLPLPSPQKPLPFITREAECRIKMGSAPFCRSCCLGAGLGVERRAGEETAPGLRGTCWGPPPREVGGAPHCVSAWEGGGAGPWPPGPQARWVGASRTFSASPLALFSVWVEFLFPGLGHEHGGGEPGSRGRSEREGEEEHRKKGSIASRRCNAAWSQRLPAAPHLPLLGHSPGRVGTGRSSSVVRNRESIPQLCSGDGLWHGSLRPD